ncbi:hypothetical protein BC938DRAFT_479911 [Jimgerdemannia flammicorona]|uniref:Uncharacterized protein n=1 Tax=Jimgerdemannia flammicorona TaxID=994334 RepID=A0A433QJU2_9FUNG|nr:hypothetical protein BC938DRAFT_479911 [Jimgerdemannia flammicorona]
MGPSRPELGHESGRFVRRDDGIRRDKRELSVAEFPSVYSQSELQLLRAGIRQDCRLIIFLRFYGCVGL